MGLVASVDMGGNSSNDTEGTSHSNSSSFNNREDEAPKKSKKKVKELEDDSMNFSKINSQLDLDEQALID